jgi:type 1 glutamine amidotransferase
LPGRHGLAYSHGLASPTGFLAWHGLPASRVVIASTNEETMLSRTIAFITFTLFAFILSISARAADAPIKVSMYSGSFEYKSDDSLKILKDYLEKNHPIVCTLNSVKTEKERMPGLDQLQTCDVAIIFTRRLELPEDQIAQIKKYCDSGKGIVGIRTASHAFQTWLDFDKLVLGGDYHNHYSKDLPATLKFEEKAKGHPVLSGVKPFTTVGKLYKNPQPAPDITRLITAVTAEYSEPVAWARIRPNDKRVFYTSLGVPEDFSDPNFLKLLANAILWTGGRNP